MEVLIESKLTASKLCDGLTIYPQLTKNEKVADKDAVLSDIDVIAAKEEAEKDLADQGRVLLRKSGTEPLIRVMCEAKTSELCEASVNKIVNAIIKKGYQVE